MIAKQFLAIFLPPLVQDKTLIITDINGNLFKTNGKTLIDEGFTKLFGTSFKDVNLPIHSKGDLLDVDKFDIVTKTTVCPKRYTQADLIKVCESPGKFLMDDTFKNLGKSLSIGQESTRSAIISGLITRDKYLETETVKKTEYVKPTPSGYMIFNNLKNCNICRVDMTALWETRLESVRTGEADANTVEKEIAREVEQMIEDIKNTNMQVVGNQKLNNNEMIKCPKCGGSIIVGPKNYFCSGWKDGCKVSSMKKIMCEASITQKDFCNALQGKTIKKKMTKNGSSWEQKLAFNLETGKWDFVK
jgi:DNA topoisomerase-3